MQFVIEKAAYQPNIGITYSAYANPIASVVPLTEALNTCSNIRHVRGLRIGTRKDRFRMIDATYIWWES